MTKNDMENILAILMVAEAELATRKANKEREVR